MRYQKTVATLLAIAILTPIILYSDYARLNDGSREVKIVEKLRVLGYVFVTPTFYFNNPTLNHSKVALLIHDADYFLNIDTIRAVEGSLKVKSAIYPRLKLFEGELNWMKLRTLESNGWEIGYQYETLSHQKGNMTAAIQEFQNNISYLLGHAWNIHTTTYHGDPTKPTINNLNLYNQTLWHSLGLNEIYALPDYSYFTDTNNQLIEPLEPLKPLVIVQLHTDYYVS